MFKNTNPDWNKYWENVNTNFKSIVEPRLNIDSVYGGYGFYKLEKNSHGWKACCPFHEDKTPSFVIYSKNLHYHCFGCQEHGTPEKFLTKTQSLTRKEALIELARRAGVDDSYLFSKSKQQISLRNKDSENEINSIRKTGIEEEIELEKRRWESISKETSSLIHRIDLLEKTSIRIVEMERIRLREIDRIRELNTIIKTKINDNLEMNLDETSEKTVRMYNFKIDKDTSFKCRYELIFNDKILTKINESTWLEKTIEENSKNIIHEEHSTYDVENEKFTKNLSNFKNYDELSIEENIHSTDAHKNLGLKISDIKDIGEKIIEKNNQLNILLANELHDLIDNSLKIPKNELQKLINSIQEDNYITDVKIKLPDNNIIKIKNIIDENSFEKNITLIKNGKEEELFSERIEKSELGTWQDINNFNEKDLNQSSNQNSSEYLLKKVKHSFVENLYSNTKEANDARNYLYKRGLSDQDIKEWGIGFTTPGLICRGIHESGWKKEDLQKDGIISDKGKEHFFGYRITFPINSSEGIIQGFSARNIYEDKEISPKYINSPTTESFSKGKILYGLDKAKEHIIEKNNVIVTEGFMDTIQMHKNGFKNTVAVMGTALRESHIHQLKNISENVTLCFDNDKAGNSAFQRSAEIAGPFLCVKKIMLENAKDPDQFLIENNKEQMAEKVQKAQIISYPSQFEQKFEKNSTKINHSLYNKNMDIDI